MNLGSASNNHYQIYFKSLIVILKDIFNISKTSKKFIIQVLKKVETFLKIIVKHVLIIHLTMISISIFNLFNTKKFLSLKY